MASEPKIAFVAAAEPRGAEVRVNFGMFAGREATPAELDQLAHLLVPEVGDVSVIGEHRHEVGEAAEASIYQVRVDVPPGADPDLVARLAEAWAEACIADRHVDLPDG